MESDNLLANLLEMGFEEGAAGPVSRSTQSLEEAIEAMLRLEIQRGEHRNPYQPSYTQTPLDVEERKDDLNFSPAAAMAAKLTKHNFQWLSLRMANLDEHGNEIEGDVAIESKPIEFEVIFSSTANPNHSLLESYTSTELMQIIKRTHNSQSNVSSPSSASSASSSSSTPHSLSSTDTPLAVSLDSVTFVGSDGAKVSYHELSHTPDSDTSPIMEAFQPVEKIEDDEETNECVICYDRVRDTLLLPCQHLCICHTCAFDYFSRTSLHNEVLLPAFQLQFQSPSDPMNTNSLYKSTSHSICCPKCAVGADVAVKLATPPSHTAAATVAGADTRDNPQQ